MGLFNFWKKKKVVTTEPKSVLHSSYSAEELNKYTKAQSTYHTTSQRESEEDDALIEGLAEAAIFGISLLGDTGGGSSGGDDSDFSGGGGESGGGGASGDF